MAPVVIVEIAGTPYALPRERIEAEADPPPVTRLPFVPTHVEGLINLYGRVVPLIHLGRQLDQGSEIPAEQGRVLLMHEEGIWYAVRVDRVLSYSEDTVSGAVQCLSVLDPGVDLIAIRPPPIHHPCLLGQKNQNAHTRLTVPVETRPIMLIELAGARYGLCLSRVRQVLELEPETLAPHPDPLYLGTLVFRDEPLTVISLTRHLYPSIPADVCASSGLVVICEADTYRFGIHVDRITSIQRVAVDQIHSFPPDPRSPSAPLELEACITHPPLAGIGLINLSRLIPHSSRPNPIVAATPAPPPTLIPSSLTDAFLMFRLGAEYCVITLDEVVRTEEHEHITRLPHHRNPALTGVIHSRGEIIPVLDLRRACGWTGPVERNDPERFILVNVRTRLWALGVDQLMQMTRIAAADFLPVQGRIPTGILALAQVRDRIVSVLNLPPLLEPHTSNPHD
ncbi:MAG: chemotaxis protein CheW [Methylococcaceae bacterium]